MSDEGLSYLYGIGFRCRCAALLFKVRLCGGEFFAGFGEAQLILIKEILEFIDRVFFLVRTVIVVDLQDEHIRPKGSARVDAVSHGFGFGLYDIQIMADSAKTHALGSEFGTVTPESLPSIFGGNVAKAGFRCSIVKYFLFAINPLVRYVFFRAEVPSGIFKSGIV